jgi:hypothetical protein
MLNHAKELICICGLRAKIHEKNKIAEKCANHQQLKQRPTAHALHASLFKSY